MRTSFHAGLATAIVAATVVACRDPVVSDRVPVIPPSSPERPVLDVLNGGMFDQSSPSCAGDQPGLTADVDGAVNILWTGVSKRFSAASVSDTFTVAWQNDSDGGLPAYRTLIVGAIADAPKYKSAWLRSSQTTYGGLQTKFHMKRWKTLTSFWCREVTATIRSSNPSSGRYYYLTTQGIVGPANFYTIAIGEAFSFYAKALNVAGDTVPVLSNDTQGNPDASGSLTITSTAPAVTVGAMSDIDWKTRTALITGAQQGTAKARLALRGFVDSSFVVNVCSPSKDVATSLELGTPPTYTLKVFQKTQFGATARNCANHTAGGTITWSSDNPSVATVSSVGLVSPLQAGTARIIVQKDGLADTTLVTVPTPEIDLSLVGPYAVRAYSSCAWQVYATVYAAGTFTYQWTKDGIPIGSNQSYVLGVPAGSTQFGIFVTVTHSSGVYPPATTSVNVTIDPNAPNCAE